MTVVTPQPYCPGVFLLQLICNNDMDPSMCIAMRQATAEGCYPTERDRTA
jgi:hypothetical protein